MNTLRTGVLLAAISALAVGVGAAFFGVNGAIIGLIVAFAFQGFSLMAGHKLALSFAKAQPLGPDELPWLHDAADTLARRAGIPTPKLYISPDPQPNAFAAGRSPEVAVVCINEGLLRLMPHDEVISVLAHEFGHIKNRDVLTMTVTAAMVSFINMLAYLAYFIPLGGDNRRGNPLVQLAIILLAPITATLIQLAISRQREFAADRASAELVGDSRPMIAALRDLDAGTGQIESRTARPATAHMYIASPFGRQGLSWFRTHPTVEQRIAALQALK
ncbi:MAG TPA: M48 family metalloprotease [Fimbriimonadaceae bacterium]|nr:M48 family metalloprotease [Fimbriimonadaceae bacterium]